MMLPWCWVVSGQLRVCCLVLRPGFRSAATLGRVCSVLIWAFLLLLLLPPQLRGWLAALCALSEDPLISFLTDNVSSILAGRGEGVELGHTHLAVLVLLAADAQLHGLQWCVCSE